MKKPDELWLCKDPEGEAVWFGLSEPDSSCDPGRWAFDPGCRVFGCGRDDSEWSKFNWLAPGTAVKLQVTSVCMRYPGLDDGYDYPTLDEVDLAIRTLEMVKERLTKERKV